MTGPISHACALFSILPIWSRLARKLVSFPVFIPLQFDERISNNQHATLHAFHCRCRALAPLVNPRIQLTTELLMTMLKEEKELCMLDTRQWDTFKPLLERHLGLKPLLAALDLDNNRSSPSSSTVWPCLYYLDIYTFSPLYISSVLRR